MKLLPRSTRSVIQLRFYIASLGLIFAVSASLIASDEATAEAIAQARANSPTGEAEMTSVKPTRDPATWIWNVPDPMPHVQHGVVYSQSMEREVGYNIFLPRGYDENPEARYPVVYFLHGVRGTEKTAANMVHLVMHELEAGHIDPVIWVYVNGGQFSAYIDWEDSYVRTETYIIEELIPAIDRRYRTVADRRGRAICGWSMGGAGSTRLAMKYPDLFCAVSSLAGAFRVMEEVNPDDSAFSWASEHADTIRDGVGLTFYCGEEDFLYEHNLALMEHLDSLKIPYTFHKVPDIGHDLRQLQLLIGHDFIRSLARYYHPASENP